MSNYIYITGDRDDFDRHFLYLVKKDFNYDDMIVRSSALPGTMASHIIDLIYHNLIVHAQDLKWLYNELYYPEFNSFKDFAVNRCCLNGQVDDAMANDDGSYLLLYGVLPSFVISMFEDEDMVGLLYKIIGVDDEN